MPTNAKVEAEKILLGALLVNNSLMMECSSLKPDYFSLDGHRRLYSAMQSLDRSGKPIDVITLEQEMGKDYSISIISETLSGAIERPSVRQWAEIIQDAAKRRYLQATCEKAIERLQQQSIETGEILDSLEQTILDTRSSGGIDKSFHVKSIIPELLNQMFAQRSRSGPAGYSVGIAAIDEMTTGIRPNEYWVIGAAPSRGKTVLGAQIAAVNASKSIPTLIFSFEMTKEQMVKRMLPIQSRVSAALVRDFRYANDYQASQIQEAGAEIASWPLWVVDPDGMGANEVAATARLHVRRYGVRIVVVDYLQIIEGDGATRREKVGSVSDVLRAFAKTEGVSVIALSQLRRPSSEEERPTMFHLKETGDIEAHAHCILLLHRPKDEQGRWTGEDEIIIAKQREGLVGTENVVLDEKKLWFVPRES